MSSLVPSHRLRIQSLAKEVEVAAGQTLLDALLAAEVDYPHGCSSGLCSLCKSRLVVGRVEHLDSYASALSDSERDSGLLLACRSHALGDCTITPVQQDALLPPLVQRIARVVAIEPLTHDIVRLCLGLEADAGFEFLAGQYARLGIGEAPMRDFSMASRPGAPSLEFFIRRLAGGRVTDVELARVAIGDRVRLQGPYGTAYLRETHIGPMLAVAGGSGLAPIRSIVTTALERGMTQPIHLCVCVRGRRDLYLVDELDALAAQHPNLSLTMLVADEASRPDEHLRTAPQCNDLPVARAYVAGPPAMVDAVAAVLAERGLPRAACHVDPFLTRPLTRESPVR